MVYYLKYRPKSLDELDNGYVGELIKKYLSQGSLPHAFLFTGPKGTGKTSTARILAKSINCPQVKKTKTACGKCDECVSITKGENLDVLEIDAASNRGIDEIRELRERIKLSPIQLAYKVYIIDEVHMLTTEAFNALLKTLEEPPRHAVFILATTEPQKIPDTVRSRCAKIDFQKASTVELVHSLERISKGEQLVVEKDVLEQIAKSADGSFRDAAMLLEEIALDTKKISMTMVTEKLRLVDAQMYLQFEKYLKEKNAQAMLKIIQDLNSEGKNIKQFFLQMIQKLEVQLIESYSQNTALNREDLVKAIRLFSQSFSNLKSYPMPELPFELAIVEFCEGIEVITGTEKLVHNTMKSANSEENLGVQIFAPPSDQSLQFWSELVEKTKKCNHSIAGVLRSCKPLFFDSKTFRIEASYPFHADRLNDAKVRETLQVTLKEIKNWDGKIEIVIKGKERS